MGVRVNNHFQSIIFGGVMMRDEKQKASSGFSRSFFNGGWEAPGYDTD